MSQRFLLHFCVILILLLSASTATADLADLSKTLDYLHKHNILYRLVAEETGNLGVMVWAQGPDSVPFEYVRYDDRGRRISKTFISQSALPPRRCAGPRSVDKDGRIYMFWENTSGLTYTVLNSQGNLFSDRQSCCGSFDSGNAGVSNGYLWSLSMVYQRVPYAGYAAASARMYCYDLNTKTCWSQQGSGVYPGYHGDGPDYLTASMFSCAVLFDDKGYCHMLYREGPKQRDQAVIEYALFDPQGQVCSIKHVVTVQVKYGIEDIPMAITLDPEGNMHFYYALITTYFQGKEDDHWDIRYIKLKSQNEAKGRRLPVVLQVPLHPCEAQEVRDKGDIFIVDSRGRITRINKPRHENIAASSQDLIPVQVP